MFYVSAFLFITWQSFFNTSLEKVSHNGRSLYVLQNASFETTDQHDEKHES